MMRKDKVRELLIIAFMAFLYVFIVLIGTGTLTSGFHLADDHEILLITERYHNGSYTWKHIFSKGLSNYLGEDNRFRPLYISLRFLRTAILGTNYVAWSVLVGMEMVGCVILAYYVVRNIGVGRAGAALVALLCITGEQGEIWWRLGPQEPTGFLTFLMCMLLIQWYEKKPGWIKAVLVIFTAFLTAASKESFTILLPVLALFGIGYDLWISSYSSFWKAVKHSLYKNRWIIVAFAINLSLNMYIIIAKVGVLSVEYAGIDVGEGISGYVWMLIRLLQKNNMRIYILFLLLTIFIFLISFPWRKGNLLIGLAKRKGVLLFAFLGIIATQMVLYAKSGMFGRYFVPFSAGIWFLCAALVDKAWKKFANYVWMGTLLLITVYLYQGVWNGGVLYTNQGEALSESFHTIESEFSPDQIIVTCMDAGGEFDYSFTQYAKIQMGMKNVYAWNGENGFFSLYQDNEKEIDTLKEANCLILPQDKGLKDFGLQEKEFQFLCNNGYGDVYKNISKRI